MLLVALEKCFARCLKFVVVLSIPTFLLLWRLNIHIVVFYFRHLTIVIKFWLDDLLLIEIYNFLLLFYEFWFSTCFYSDHFRITMKWILWILSMRKWKIESFLIFIVVIRFLSLFLIFIIYCSTDNLKWLKRERRQWTLSCC
jgi:hypothetical protein